MVRRSRLPVLLAPLGVVAGHTLGYLLAHPDRAERAHALTGHGWLPTLAVLGAAPALASLTGAAASGVRGRRRAFSVLGLAALQVGLFVGIELLEHALSGAGALAALREPGLWLGLPAQLLFAVLGLGLLRTGAALGAALARTRRTGPRGRAPLAATRPGMRIPAIVPIGSISRRGPPRRAASS